jgi:GPH family glycoside/pentoside/hexuronide:cation symporter
MAFIIVGTVVASIAPAVLASAGIADPRRQMHLIALAFGGALIFFFGLLVVTTRERRDARTHTDNPLVPGVRRALRNRPFRILFLTFVIGSLPSAIPALMLPFFISYVIQPENPEQILGFFLLLYFVSSFLFLPFWVWLAGRIGKLNAWLASFGIGISAGIALFFAGQGDVTYVALLHVWAGVAFGAGGLLVPSMQADVVDYDELHTGKRREAQFAAFWAIVPKFVAIPGAALPIAALAAIGYVPNAVQTPDVQLGIRVIYALVPAVFGIASYFLARLYPITEAVHAEIKAGIAAHGRGELARDPLSGESFAAPASRAIDEETGWYLDYFSPRELAVLAAGQSSGLVRTVGLKFAVSAALTVVFFAIAVRGLGSLDTEPGLTPVMSVVGGGFALTAACFHALRLSRARRMERTPIAPEIVRMHLGGITGAQSVLRRAA